ncbi:MAG: mannitol dehydrogenase family protein [Pseudomonadota bacterium]
MNRLQSVSDGRAEIARPAYHPAAHGIGIVHLGPGAFHRAHQAVYTDAALSAEGGNWRIAGVSLRSTGAEDALAPQNGFYTLLQDGPEQIPPRLIGAVGECRTLSRDRGRVMELLTSPATRIITLTVTEKAYGFDRATGDLIPGHDAERDRSGPRDPSSVIGILVEALRHRRAAGTAPPTLLSCDNLPDNGTVVRAALLAYADPALRDWIARTVPCPSCMVDRITPAPTDRTRTRVAKLCGYEDRAAIAAEPFSQWVIEDRFPTGRPAWEAGGAQFVTDVAPFEAMKLGMLNGAHSCLAYAGLAAGHQLVREAVADPGLRALAARLMDDAARTVPVVAGMDLARYRDDLIARFANPAMDHALAQIAMDGSQKLPQRILDPARALIGDGHAAAAHAMAFAAWIHHLRQNAGGSVSDPMAEALMQVFRTAGTGAETVRAVLGQLGLSRSDALTVSGWVDRVAMNLDGFASGDPSDVIGRAAP